MEPLDYSIFPERPVIYATFWERLVAALIDGMIALTINFILSSFLGSYALVASMTNIVVTWLYYAAQEAGPNMATIGKKVMNIKVTDLNGGRITFGQATGRYFGKWISTVFLLIGYFMMLWDEKNQTLHDKIAGTLIVKV